MIFIWGYKKPLSDISIGKVTENDLGQYLSRNTQLYMTTEGDAENLIRALGEYVSAVGRGVDRETAMRNALGDEKQDSLLSTLMRCSNTLVYLEQLYSCGKLFRFSDPMTKKWMKANVNGVFGGVGILLIHDISYE